MGKLTESEYTTIKQLLSKGYEGKKVAEIVQRGAGTVSAVKNSNGFGDYIKRQKRAEKPAEPKKQTELPLDKPKKTTLDLRENIMLKINGLYDAVMLYKRSGIKLDNVSTHQYDMALDHLEIARLLIMETF